MQDPNADAANEKKENVLMEAAAGGHVPVVWALLEKGANPRATDADGWTALMFASAQGHAAVAKMLIDKGSDVSARDKFGVSANALAQQYGHDDVIAVLAAPPSRR